MVDVGALSANSNMKQGEQVRSNDTLVSCRVTASINCIVIHAQSWKKSFQRGHGWPPEVSRLFTHPHARARPRLLPLRATRPSPFSPCQILQQPDLDLLSLCHVARRRQCCSPTGCSASVSCRSSARTHVCITLLRLDGAHCAGYSVLNPIPGLCP